MSNDTLTDDIALRIGLAARTLPDPDPARLIRVLADAVGLPPTATTLETLRVKDLKQAADGELADLDVDLLKSMLAILKGETGQTIAPAPPVEPYAEGDMPGSVRVACASNGGDELDGHFGAARHFLVYQVSAHEIRLIDVRGVDESGTVEDKNGQRAALIADCQVLYVASIGGPAAAKVVKTDIHPIKDAAGGSARERMVALQRILGEKAPPWLAKAMGQTPEQRVRFARSQDAA
ncbi:MAG: dinitrogenase iron-molybdenum cofactor biosynthesis protein [Thiocapsa sp.]|uniref:dinitrogenase iron-molybdenum cofactor biosynthesis protein n=1 Tax=Thiocapsa sp. TaxID=2024551 RepID=UPI001BCE5B9E|nr:dinitrogenase iron-molybdenum cofactor biosynthesis protein [Thiocapsa sp.]QVL51105.1 MAG: dinitrogenase iron-molybdenum cofactor biosynthesis protein [Thiocapsa sp.]